MGWKKKKINKKVESFDWEGTNQFIQFTNPIGSIFKTKLITISM